ncbi:hypothetical protein EPUS_08755 [Endocarpon pusillum Z07020]|uniref:Uncharacterized protein n=1 Tax=Endocarpon pusillum (strain Z07020 / HMAS-L-300199) TaxID=1263415 RepID=U1GMQ1_ENDPU|nr:uncharacterized protein EPUS_08755 [Endocarpon pusillum Z07020]ERF73548.1 hypothetical protein EPUS_08755 [Endocarpon pusillum Z07020]
MPSPPPDDSAREAEAEFPGIPSTQDWREDFPATQFPQSRPRNAYITPETSFTVPSDETEVDGFDLQVLVDVPVPQTPARALNESQRMPPTPMSVTKGSSCYEKVHSLVTNSTVRASDKLKDASTVVSQTLQASPSRPVTKTTVKSEEASVPRRRRRRPKKRSRAQQPCSQTLQSNAKDTAPATHPSSTPEPWPLPFPLADKGIYPYLPPAKQFDQMVKFTSATEEHIDKWNIHEDTYPIPLLRQVLSVQECVHMGLYVQLEYMDKMLGELEKSMKPETAKERARKGKRGDKYQKITPRMLEKIRFMRSITRQHQVCYYESRIPTRPNLRNPKD